MKKTSNKLFFIIIIFIIFLIGGKVTKVEAVDAEGNFVVVLDPGHGGSDPGASGGGLVEAIINYKIACYTKMELEQYEGVKVYLTRNNNLPSLAERVNIAKNYNADLLISMHINSGSINSKGAAIWVTADKTQVEYYKKSAEVGSKILSKIASIGITNNGIQTRLSNENRWYDSGAKQDYYGIIRNAQLIKMRSILIEHCFISNSMDRTYISSDSKIKTLAHADVMGIVESYDLHKKGQGYTPVKYISMNVNELTLESKTNDLQPVYYFSLTFNPTNCSNQDVEWYSTNPDVVRVWNGKIRGLKEGTAVVKAISKSNQRMATCKVTVTKQKKYVEDIKWEKDEYMIDVNQAVDIPFTYSPTDANNAEFIWSSSNPELLRVWNNRFRGLKPGTAYVIARTKDGRFEKKIKVIIKDIPVTNINWKQDEYNITINEAVDIPFTYSPTNATNAKFIWSSSNSEILRVWNNRFRGLKPGTAYVIARTKDGRFEKKIKVVIKDIPVTNINWKQDEYNITINEAVDIPFTYSPTNATNAKFVWSSSNPTILRVWNNRFRGLKAGTAYVIAKTEDGRFEKKIKVVIKDIPVTNINWKKDEYNITINEAVDIPFTYSPTNATNAEFIWSSSNPEILRVWNNRFRGLKIGTAYVDVKTKDGKFEKRIKVIIKDNEFKNE